MNEWPAQPRTPAAESHPDTHARWCAAADLAADDPLALDPQPSQRDRHPLRFSGGGVCGETHCLALFIHSARHQRDDATLSYLPGMSSLWVRLCRDSCRSTTIRICGVWRAVGGIHYLSVLFHCLSLSFHCLQLRCRPVRCSCYTLTTPNPAANGRSCSPALGARSPLFSLPFHCPPSALRSLFARCSLPCALL